MGWAEIIAGIVKLANTLLAWLRPTATEKVESGKEDVREDSEHMRRNGRPKA